LVVRLELQLHDALFRLSESRDNSVLIEHSEGYLIVLIVGEGWTGQTFTSEILVLEDCQVSLNWSGAVDLEFKVHSLIGELVDKGKLSFASVLRGY